MNTHVFSLLIRFINLEKGLLNQKLVLSTVNSNAVILPKMVSHKLKYIRSAINNVYIEYIYPFLYYYGIPLSAKCQHISIHDKHISK